MSVNPVNQRSPLFLCAAFLAAGLVGGLDGHAAANASAVTVGGPVRHGPSNSPSESTMRQHYDEAYRLQSAGQIEKSDVEHKLFLAEALHHIANGRANIGDYDRAVPVYEQAQQLNLDDFSLRLDYAKAAMDAEDAAKAVFLAQGILNQRLRMAGPQEASVRRLLGEALWNVGEHGKALEQYKAAAAVDPDFDNIYALGQQELARGDRDSGSKVFARMLAKFGDSATMDMDVGLAYAKNNYFPEAIEEFKAAIAKDGRMPGAHYSLGACYMSLPGQDANFSKAEAEFRKELEVQPSDKLSYPQLGRIALSRHNYWEAELDLNRSAALSPDDADTFLMLGQLYTETDRQTEAEVALAKAIALTLDPSRNHYAIHTAHYQLGRLLIKLGKKAEGRNEMQIAEQLMSESRQQDQNTLSGKAAVQMPLQKTRVSAPPETAAETAFEERARPLIAGSYNNLGVHAAIAKDYDRAATFFGQASQWEPTFAGLDSNLGFAAYAAHRYALAVAPLGRLLIARPRDNEVRVALGVSQYRVHDYHSAALTFEPIRVSMATVPFLALADAESMARGGQSPEGMNCLRAIEQAHPESSTVHRALGEAYAAEGESQQALDELRTAVRMDPSDEDSEYALASNLAAFGQAPESEAILAPLAAAGSQDSRIYSEMGRLRLDRGDVQGAIKSLEAAVKVNPENGAAHLALAEAYHRNSQVPDARREATLSQALLAWRPPGNAATSAVGSPTN